ncbi:beta-N-acetylhexosaminidase [Algibacter lectus]|nr:family 20 glycosylhydrolase [Algibacter lectus]
MKLEKDGGVFPEIYAPSEETFKFLEDVLTEVIALFPSKLIHIGGDEAPKKQWEASKLAQDIIKREGLKDEHELQSYFIRRIEKFLNSKGRNIIGWDEILEGGLAPNATVMSWRGEKGGIQAAKMHHNVVMTPTRFCYFDFYQTKDRTNEPLAIGGNTSVEQVYSYNPSPKELTKEEQKYILGAQANVWTEYIKTPEQVEYMVLPRLTALSEVVWSSYETKDWNDFQTRLIHLTKRYEALGLNYAKHSLEIKTEK